MAAAGVPATAGAAVAEPDSTSVELDEVVVEGRTQRVIRHGVEYVPDRRVKRAATDATHLLWLMQIPRLRVSPADMSVATQTGAKVSMYIDGKPATAQELAGLRPEDVFRVEVLDYPDDPRFDGAEHVVNYVMRQYEWGGYTKLTATGATLDADKIGGNVYSRFVRRRWTFDASADASWSHDDRQSSHSEELYRGISISDIPHEAVSRVSDTDGALSRTNSQWVSARADYNADNIFIRHGLSFSRTGTPLSRTVSAVRYFGAGLPSSEAVSRESGQTLSPAVSGYYRFTLPRGNSLNVSWSLGHSGTWRTSSYRLGELPPVVNDNRERAWTPNASVSYSKRFSHDNTFRTSLITYNSLFDTHYAGSYDGRQKLLSSETMLFAEYMQNWRCGLSLYSRAGASYVVGRVNGVNTLEQWNPRLGVQLQYGGDKHAASIEGWWGNSHPQPSSANSALVQTNELMWSQGNPDLRNTIFAQSTANYTYMPTNKFDISVSAQYEGNYDRQANEYLTLPGHDGLVRRTVNSGDAHQYSAWMTATLRLFGNSLSVSATGEARRVVLTGLDARSAGWLAGNAQASYYIGGFSATMWYASPQKSINGWTNGFCYTIRSTYGLSATYSAGGFKASLDFRNWFSKGYVFGDFSSPHYGIDTRMRESGASRSISLTLSYTFSYGRKVGNRDELGGGRGTGSAILR